MKKIKNLILPGLMVMLAATSIPFITKADATEVSTKISKTLMERPCLGKKNFKNLTEEEKAEMKTKMEERMAEQKKKTEAIETAINANDYDAWVLAVGSDSPMLEKITKDNFSKLIEIYNLKKQVIEKEKELGIKPEMDGGRGHFGEGEKPAEEIATTNQ
jgi:hypothetical protein